MKAKLVFFERLAGLQPNHACLPILASLISGPDILLASCARTCDVGSWLVLPYFRGFASIPKVLDQLREKFCRLGYGHLFPRISWASHGRNLLQQTLHDSSTKLKLV